MKRRSVVLCMLLLGISLSQAHAVPSVAGTYQTANESVVVPADDKAYNCVDELQKAGIVIGPPEGGTYSRLSMTRYQFGVAIARLLFLLPPITPETLRSDDLDAIRNDFHQKLSQRPAAVDALLTLIDEFTPEVQKSYPGVVQAREQLVRLQVISASFTDVPQGDKAYDCIETLLKVGIYIGYPDGNINPRRMNRYQFAVAIARQVNLLEPIPAEASKSPEIDAIIRDFHQKLDYNPKALDALLMLMDEFMPQLKILNASAVNVREQLAQMRNIVTPFPDVPTKHWAYQSVEAVRRAGSVVGYPNHEFRTDDTERGTTQ